MRTSRPYETLFSAWLTERKLDARAKRDGMERQVTAEKVLRQRVEPNKRVAFVGRLVYQADDDAFQLFRTRKGSLAVYWLANSRRHFEVFDSLEALEAVWGIPEPGLMEAVRSAIEDEPEELDI